MSGNEQREPDNRNNLKESPSPPHHEQQSPTSASTAMIPTAPLNIPENRLMPMPSSSSEHQSSSRTMSNLGGELPMIQRRTRRPTTTSESSMSSSEQQITHTMPCGARGMPADHNFQNAYFTIHQGTKHGDELICSHSLCRAGGVKFCYCAYCKVPCAKRNFRTRHLHADETDSSATQSQAMNDSNDTMERLALAQSLHGVIQDSSSFAARSSNNNHVVSNSALNAPPASFRPNPSPNSQQTLVKELANFAAQHILSGLQGFSGNNSNAIQNSQSQHPINQQSAAATTVASAAEANSIGSSDRDDSSRDASRIQQSEAAAFIGMSHPPIAGSAIHGGNMNSTTSSTGETSGRKRKRVACRARGMPPEHNAENAYFDVPEDVKHGDELVCSFPECRNSGVKFCFCTYCNIPVAKRNFRIRHNHCDYAPPAPTVAEALAAAGSTLTLPLPERSNDHARSTRSSIQFDLPTSPLQRKKLKESDGAKKQSNASNSVKESETHDSKNGNDIAVERNSAASQDGGSSGDIPSNTDESGITPERMAAWDQLLDRRPRQLDSAEMATWLASVMAISSVDAPGVEQTASASERAPQQQAKNSSESRDDAKTAKGQTSV